MFFSIFFSFTMTTMFKIPWIVLIKSEPVAHRVARIGREFLFESTTEFVLITEEVAGGERSSVFAIDFNAFVRIKLSMLFNFVRLTIVHSRKTRDSSVLVELAYWCMERPFDWSRCFLAFRFIEQTKRSSNRMSMFVNGERHVDVIQRQMKIVRSRFHFQAQSQKTQISTRFHH